MRRTGERALGQAGRGEGAAAEPDMSKYKHLSETMKAKLAAALKAKAAAGQADVPGVGHLLAQARCMPWHTHFVTQPLLAFGYQANRPRRPFTVVTRPFSRRLLLGRQQRAPRHREHRRGNVHLRRPDRAEARRRLWRGS